MIKHIVLWTFKAGPDKAAQVARAKAMLQACAELAPGTVSFEVASVEDGLEANVDLALCSVFTDQAALDAYQEHPQHLELKRFLGTVRDTRHVIDYTV